MAQVRASRGVGFIDSETDLRRGVRALRRVCGDMRRIHDLAGDPPLRRHAAGFEGLSRIVVGQQLSIASAEAIWARTRVTVRPFTARRLLAADEGDLAAAGLSRGKIRTLRALAERIAAGEIAIGRLASADERDVHAALTAVPGIGPWTADIFLLFCAGRADAWPAGDLALQVATQSMLAMDARPGADQLADIAERWRPWRGVAARLLWQYYTVSKARHAAEPL